MNDTVNREKFHQMLTLVKGGLSPREFVEQSSCFVFQGGFICTFNDEVACRMPVPLDFTGAVQAQQLLDILEKVEDVDLFVRVNKKGELEFKGDGKAFGITMDAEIFMPLDRVETPKDDRWAPLDDEFLIALDLVKHCVGTDESKFLLTCVHFHPDYIEACDNHQIMRYHIDTGLSKPFLLRGTSIAGIKNLGMTHIALTKSWVHFRNAAELTMSCRRYTEEYPDLNGAISAKGGEPIVIPKGLAKAAERAAIFAVTQPGSPLIKVSLSQDVLHITGLGVVGWYTEAKDVSYNGPDMRFVISPELLQKLSETHSNASISPTKLKVESAKKWEYVTVLGVADEPSAPAEEAPKKKK